VQRTLAEMQRALHLKPGNGPTAKGRWNVKHRVFAIFVLVSILLSTRGLAPVAAEQPEGTALVQIAWQSQADLAAVEASGVPVYARLTGQSGAYLLAGATSWELEALHAGGLDVTLLDADLRGATYYVAYPMPGGVRPDWEVYGRLLLDDGVQVLLRATPQDAERLVEAGVQLQAVTFDPKPLGPAPVTGSIPTAVDPDPLIQTMIDQVDSATVSQYDRELAGKLPVWVDGAWYTITTRYTYSGVPIQKATNYVGQHMADLGLNVEYHHWGGNSYPNVIGELPGLVNPDEIFIIGGHIDDVQGTPGADDNASGSVATLIAADIATQYQWGCTLRFALWTGEEQGMLGSHAYAQRSYNQGESIVGYLNLDMIAYNTPASSADIDLVYNSSMPPTLQLAQLFADVVDAYNLNLIPELTTSQGGWSDHSSFWQYGYTSILGMEDQEDFNPYYHKAGDTPAHTDLAYFTNFVKASIGTFAHMTGCLVGVGHIDGHVTAASSGDPIAQATVTMEDEGGHAFATLTDPSGYYTQTLLTGVYTVTAEAYGYLPDSVAGVVVTTDTVTTQDFALQAAPTYVVSGTVAEAGTGDPLFAQVEFQGSGVTVWTDPATGFYQAAFAGGAYTMRVTADLHRSEERPIVVDHGQTQNFYLDPLPCILLVDDDNNNPDVLPYFTGALDDLGYDYDVFDVGGGGADGPDLAGLQGYNMVFWFSGDKWGGSAGPNGTDEAALAAYLDGGGKLFLSSQDYLYDFGLTPFGEDYLGIGSYTDDSGDAVFKYGVAGDPIGDGLGPYPLYYPAGFSPDGDIVNPGAGVSVAFRSSAGGGNNLDVDKDGGDWRTVFFGTSWVPVYNYKASYGEEVLQRIVDWFGGCESHDGWLTGQVTDALSGEPLVSAQVTVQPSARGELLAPTDPNGHYTMTLPTGTYDVTASKAGYDPETAVAVNVQAGMTTTQDFALQPMQAIVVEPPSLEATLYPDDVTTHTLWVTNTGESDLTFAVYELSRTLTVAAGPLVQPRAEPLVEPEGMDQVLAEGQAEVIIHPREQAVSLTLGEVSYDIPWLSVDPAGATLGPGAGISLSVAFDAAGLKPGAYLGLLDVESDDPVAPHVSVPVTLTVEAPCYPVEVVTVTTDISGCAVAFDAVLTGTAPFTYAWDFGAFGPSSVPTPTIDFGASSSYPYALTALNCNGIYSDTLSGMVTVDCGIACEPVDILTITTEITGCAVAFGVELTGTAPYAYAWDFGAFGSSTEPAPTVDFEISGTHAYSLTALNCGTYTTTMASLATVACEPPAVYYYLPLVVRQK
jgi:hypothetical protein